MLPECVYFSPGGRESRLIDRGDVDIVYHITGVTGHLEIQQIGLHCIVPGNVYAVYLIQHLKVKMLMMLYSMHVLLLLMHRPM